MAIYTPTIEKPRRTNRMPAIYAAAKCFKSTYLFLSLPFGEEIYPIKKKLPVGSLLHV